MNLIKEIPLSVGSKLEEKEESLVLVSLPNPQSEQTPGIFPGIGSHMKGIGCNLGVSWREPSRGVNSICRCSPANPVAPGGSVTNRSEERCWGPKYGKRVIKAFATQPDGLFGAGGNISLF